MTYSLRNLTLALGFFSISVFPAFFSWVLRYFHLGGNSIRTGLVISILIFFILVIPFGVRYFITPKIIITNILLCLIITLSYILSSLIFQDVDNTRFLLSLLLLFAISIASLCFATTLDLLNDEFFHKMIFVGFYFLLSIGFIVLFRTYFLGSISRSTESYLSFIFFSEASHYAITLTPFLFYAVYSSSKKRYAILYLISTTFIALYIENLTLLVGCLMVFFITFGRRVWLLGILISMIVLAAIYFDASYFLERLDFTTYNRNTSTLVFLSGWERAYLAFFDSFGFGVGFQQIGITGPQGNIQDILKDLLSSSNWKFDPGLAKVYQYHNGLVFEATHLGLNWNDGGSLASKLVAELGFLGLILLLLYCYFAISILKEFLLKNIKKPINIYFFGVYLLFSIELFVRGMGYFSLTSFIFISSIYWIYRSQLISRKH